MGCVQQAVLEFDGEVQAPWRPRLAPEPAPGDAASARALWSHPSRRSPSRVGVSRPPAPPSRPVGPTGRVTSRPEGRAVAPGGRSAARPVPGRRTAPGRAATVRLRLTRRARRLSVVLALAAGVALGSWLGPLIGGGDDLRLVGESSVVVQSGDTLWSIASSLDDDGDVRALVDELQRLNGLGGTELVPGQVLQLP
jgi:nucleoid-associated protein YgaU